MMRVYVHESKNRKRKKIAKVKVWVWIFEIYQQEPTNKANCRGKHGDTKEI